MIAGMKNFYDTGIPFALDTGWFDPLETFCWVWCVIVQNLVFLLQCYPLPNRQLKNLPRWGPLSRRVWAQNLIIFISQVLWTAWEFLSKSALNFLSYSVHTNKTDKQISRMITLSSVAVGDNYDYWLWCLVQQRTILNSIWTAMHGHHQQLGEIWWTMQQTLSIYLMFSDISWHIDSTLSHSEH